MAYIPMYELLPDKAIQTITMLENDQGIPPGDYDLIEMYCNDKNCDCRRVMWNVVTPHNMESVAMISYGWEGIEYYKKWMKMDSNRELEAGELYLLEEMKGPSLELSSPQGEHAEDILEIMEDIISKNEDFVNSIKERYSQFRKKVDEIHTRKAISKKIGRNAPCPCGSGKKHKKCCMGKDIVMGEEALQPMANTDADTDANATDFSNIDLAKEVEDADLNEEFLLELRDAFQQMSLDFRMRALKKKPHIKEYQKARKIHSEIVNSMMDDHYKGKFEQKIETETTPSNDKETQNLEEKNYMLLESSFDFENPVSFKAFQDMVTYKPSKNMNSLTEEYIAKNRYRREDKKEFLQSMLKSRLGLFQAVDIDKEDGYVFLEDIFTGEKVQIIDIALSGGQNIESQYFYTRIITYRGFSFGTGLNFVFNKTDPFIKKFIRQEKKNYRGDGEFRRFIQLYNQYIQNEDSVPSRPNVVK